MSASVIGAAGLAPAPDGHALRPYSCTALARTDISAIIGKLKRPQHAVDLSQANERSSWNI